MGLIIMIVGTYVPLYLKSSVQTLINYRHRQSLQTWSCRCSRVWSHTQLGARSFPAGESLDHICDPSVGKTPSFLPQKVTKNNLCPCKLHKGSGRIWLLLIPGKTLGWLLIWSNLEFQPPYGCRCCFFGGDAAFPKIYS